MFKKGKVIPKGKRISITQAAPDDPIYQRGYFIGGVYPPRKKRDPSFKEGLKLYYEMMDKFHGKPMTQEDHNLMFDLFLKYGMREEMRVQMGGKPTFNLVGLLELSSEHSCLYCGQVIEEFESEACIECSYEHGDY
jgi:hypothetical protein